jgi:hypothetical protein
MAVVVHIATADPVAVGSAVVASALDGRLAATLSATLGITVTISGADAVSVVNVTPVASGDAAAAPTIASVSVTAAAAIATAGIVTVCVAALGYRRHVLRRRSATKPERGVIALKPATIINVSSRTAGTSPPPPRKKGDANFASVLPI